MLTFLLIVAAAYLFATKQQGEVALHRTEPSYRAQPCGALAQAGLTAPAVAGQLERGVRPHLPRQDEEYELPNILRFACAADLITLPGRANNIKNELGATLKQQLQQKGEWE